MHSLSWIDLAMAGVAAAALMVALWVAKKAVEAVFALVTEAARGAVLVARTVWAVPAWFLGTTTGRVIAVAGALGGTGFTPVAKCLPVASPGVAIERFALCMGREIFKQEVTDPLREVKETLTSLGGGVPPPTGKKRRRRPVEVHRSSAKTQLQKNAKAGKDWEDEVIEAPGGLKEQHPSTQREVLIAPLDDSGRELRKPDGRTQRTRVDAIYRAPDGSTPCIECKGSPSAPLRSGQRVSFPQLRKNGGVVKSRNKPGFPPGLVLKPSDVEIRRKGAETLKRKGGGS